MGAIAEALAALAKADVPLLLIGGNALQAFGYTRATLDVDCLIAVESAERLKEVLGANGFPWVGGMALFHEFWHHGRKDESPIHAMRVDATTFGKMWSRSIPAEISGIPLRVPCLPHLLALKLFSAKQNPKRHNKDFQDVCILLQKNPDKISREELGQVCQQYASQEAVNELRLQGFL